MSKPPESLPPEVLAAFERRQPLEAIKLLLAMRAGATSHAKPASQTPAQRATTKRPPAPRDDVSGFADGLSPGEVPRVSSSFWAWVVVALFVYLGYLLLRG